MKDFTHLDDNGKVQMVDISDKPISKRKAQGTGKIYLLPSTINAINEGNIKKGSVLTTAKIAAISAAKNTFNTIPLCHQIQLTNVKIDFVINEDHIVINSTVSSIDKTGPEIEAIHCVMIAALTIYDMCKAIDKKMRIEGVCLWEKSKQSV